MKKNNFFRIRFPDFWFSDKKGISNTSVKIRIFDPGIIAKSVIVTFDESLFMNNSFDHRGFQRIIKKHFSCEKNDLNFLFIEKKWTTQIFGLDINLNCSDFFDPAIRS